MARYTSGIIMSSFLGMESLQEELHDKPITECMMELSNIAAEGLKDPFLIFFGTKFLNLKLRKKDRRYLGLSKEIQDVLVSYVRKV
jgi:hypothetical protein